MRGERGEGRGERGEGRGERGEGKGEGRGREERGEAIQFDCILVFECSTCCSDRVLGR